MEDTNQNIITNKTPDILDIKPVARLQTIVKIVVAVATLAAPAPVVAMMVVVVAATGVSKYFGQQLFIDSNTFYLICLIYLFYSYICFIIYTLYCMCY